MLMKIGQKIKKIRELRDFSQDYMAASLGISVGYYSKIENDATKTVSLEMIDKISTILEISPSALLDFDASNYINTITNSQFVGFRDYINGTDASEALNQCLAHNETLKQEIQFLKEQILILNKLIKMD